MYKKLCFKSYYDRENNHFYPDIQYYAGKIDLKYLIEDCYHILLCRSSSGEYSAYERDKIENFANENNISTTDLHINFGGDLCVAPKNTEHYILNSKNEKNFTEKLVIPFLYSHSFFEKYKERPWPDYSHGSAGFLEAYIRDTAPDSREKTLRTMSNLKYWNNVSMKILENEIVIENVNLSSNEAKNGLNKLKNDIKKFGLKKFLNKNT